MTEATLTCANHPTTETRLRCNRCSKPICNRCAVQTPVGYRCRECVRGQQAVFETTRTFDYPVAAAVSGIGTALAVAFLGFLGFWGFFVAPILGGGLGEAVRWSVGRRRSRYLGRWAIVGGILGMLAVVGFRLLPILILAARGAGLGILGGSLLSLPFPLIYGVLILSTLYWRLHGIRM